MWFLFYDFWEDDFKRFCEIINTRESFVVVSVKALISQVVTLHSLRLYKPLKFETNDVIKF